MGKIKIATDSTADIPIHLRKSLNISVLPLTIITENREYKDGYEITPQEFYDILENSEKIPTSSQVTPLLNLDLYEETWKAGYTDLIQICLNSKGSHTWHNAVSASEMFYEEHPEAREQLKIHIFDSKNYSMAYGYAAVKAAIMAQMDESIDDILAFVEDWLEHARAVFVPMNLKFVKKSGRIPAAVAFVGDALGLKPVITFIDGESKIISKIRGDLKVVSSILDLVNKDRKPDTPYCIAAGSNAAQFEKLKANCQEALGCAPDIEYYLGCIISQNAGPNAIGIIYYAK